MVNRLPQHLYHATTSNVVASIKKYGLGGKMPKQLWWDYTNTEYEHRSVGVFLADDEYVAESFLECSETFENFAEHYQEQYNQELEIIVFQINTSDLDLDKLSIDTNNRNDEYPTYFYNGVIDYQNLKIIEL